jgi:glycosyltransferase involved in cell wall biosynthesis
VTGLTRSIRDLVRDPARARRLGEAGRARAIAHFGAEAMIAQFAELYEHLARSKGSGRPLPEDSPAERHESS